MNEQKIIKLLEGLPEEEARQRLATVREAVSWTPTPYHANSDVKGAGVDCGMYLIKVFSTVGVIEYFDPRPYPVQWSFNQRAERYLEWVKKFSVEVQGPPLPGDVVLFKVGHCWAHGSIVLDWPCIVHANPPRCKEDNWRDNFSLSARTPRFFSPWHK